MARKANGVRGECGKRIYHGFCGKEWMRQGKADSGLMRMKSFREFWGVEPVPCHLVSGPRVMRWVERGLEGDSHRGGWELWIGWLAMHGSCLYYL